MKNIQIEMTQEELVLAITLMSDQLFRREFIDPKMPGYKGDPTELAMGKDLVLRLKSAIREAADSPAQSVAKRNSNHSSFNTNGVRNAV